MKDSDIVKAAIRFRNAITLTSKSDFPWNSSMAVSQFPSACCGDASQTLATFLYSELQIICDYVLGRRGGNSKEIGSHAWLEIDNLVIDITADQFNGRGYHLREVYVGPRTDWYKTFEIGVTKDGRHTSLSDKGSLDGVYATILSRL